MLLEGTFTLRAPIQEVWDTILEPTTLGSCLPGAQKVEKIDDTTYDAVVTQKAGPLKITLKFRNFLTKMEAPHHIEFEGEGEEINKLGHFRQKTAVDLKEREGGEVEVSYTANVNIVGKLAMFGDRFMKSKAKEVEKEFTRNLKERLEGTVHREA
jgi:uncharacterized protein